MRKGKVLLIVCAVAAIPIVAGIQQLQAQRSAGGRPGGFGGRNVAGMITGDLESSWAYVSFELGIENDALIKARKLYQKAWAEQAEVLKTIEKAGGGMGTIQAARAEVQKIIKDLHAKLVDVLSPEQMDKLNKWQAAKQQGSQQRRGR